MDVCLYRVRRNLNRAYRLCAAFGISRLLLWACDEALLTGHLYAARGRVHVQTLELPLVLATTCLLATRGGRPLGEMPWHTIATVLVGGETCEPPLHPHWQAHIPLIGDTCLTVEAALAIALYVWRTSHV